MTYSYKVVAINSYGSAESAIVSATTGEYGISGGPGSSASTAIQLYPSYSNWTNGTIDADSPEMWYRVDIPDNGTYYLLGKDGYIFPSSYTGDVSFMIYDSGLNSITAIDAGNGGTATSPGGANGYNYLKGSWSPGWLYIKVVPFNGNTHNYGTFAIYFY
jgi:hypothetical protein